MSNGRLQTILSEEEWRNQKPSRQTLTKKEAKTRYNQYLLSAAVGGPNYSKKRENYRKGNNTSPKSKNPGGYTKTLGSLSECSRDYALALMDPWNVPRPPCIPDTIVLPSYKFSCNARGTFVIGTAGCGFVDASPYIPYNGYTSDPLNPVYQGVFTNSGYSRTDYTRFPSDGGTSKYANDSALDVNNAGSQSEDTGTYRYGFQYRVVGCGIKVRYLGSEMNRSGRIVAYRSPLNDSINTPMTVNEMLKDKEVSTVVNDRVWHYVTYRPVDPSDITYYGLTGATGNADATLLLFVEGAEVGASFEFEVISHFEVIGPLLPSKSKSHSDVLGMAAVMQALPAHTPTRAPESDAKTFIKSVIETGESVFSFVSNHVIPMGKAIAPLLM